MKAQTQIYIWQHSSKIVKNQKVLQDCILSQILINKIHREKIKHYSRSPDEKTDLNPNSLEKIANNFFVKNKDKFHIATPLKKRAAELSKEQFASTKAEWLKKALASHRSKLKPQFKAL